jgi:uncharacterized OsmC-like protein
MVLRRIHVTYRFRPEAGADREAIDRVARVHQHACPVYRSLHPQIHITTELELIEPA